jgi:hypothetical protein
MTREEQLQCIEDNVDAFKKTLLAKASKIPPNWDSAEIKQWVMGSAKNRLGAEDGQDADAPYQMAKQVYGL